MIPNELSVCQIIKGVRNLLVRVPDTFGSRSGQRKALFIDTSGERARVVLIVDGVVVKSVVWSVGFAAGKEVLEKINEMMSNSSVRLSEIERIGVCSGPGKRSSTLRSGVTVAAFLAYSCGARLVVVDESEEGELADAVFAASPQSIVKPNYDKLAFDSSRKKA